MKKNETTGNNDSPIEQYFESNDSSLKQIKKNHILQMPGTNASKAYYVKSGLLRSYAIDDNGKVHIFMFAPEGWVISDIESHEMSMPSELFIDVLEDSEVIEIDRESIEIQRVRTSENIKVTKKLFRRIAVLQRRVLLLMSATAKQRYEHFIDTYPQLTNRVSLKMIASYLGITPEALSNIRSKMRTPKK